MEFKTQLFTMQHGKRGPMTTNEHIVLADGSPGPAVIRLRPSTLLNANKPLFLPSGNWFAQEQLRVNPWHKFLHFGVPSIFGTITISVAMFWDPDATTHLLAHIMLFFAIWGASFILLTVIEHHLEKHFRDIWGIIAHRQNLAQQYGPKEAHGSTPRLMDESDWAEQRTKWWVFISNETPPPLPQKN